MANMKDISCQLMKSPKELASWNFPLSEILDKYFNLLPEACKIQYGEAAFVIQNSVNAYVRRVEELYDETRSLNHKIVNKESIKDKLITVQNGIKTKKFKIDFDQFHIYEFDKEIGKNINFKAHEQKNVKCLHHCFSQLENPHAKLTIELFDVLGEVIGKKYDFRCSQKLTKSGSLVDEFAEKDFTAVENLKSTFYNTSFICNNTSGEFDKFNSHSQIENSSLNRLQSEDINFNSTTPITNLHFSPLPSNKTSHLNIHISTLEFEENFCLLSDSSCTMYDGYLSEKNDTSDKEIEFKNTRDTSHCSESETHHHKDDSFTDKNKCKSLSENMNMFEEATSPTPSEDKIHKTISKMPNDGSESIEFTSGLRRSKRLRADSEFKSGLNNNSVLKPLPFQDGIPEKLIKSRKEFQLPCNVNLLKNDSKRIRRTKKIKNILKPRPVVPAVQKNNFLDKNECEIANRINTTHYSEMESQLTAMKEEEANESRRSHSEILCNNEELVDNSIPVTQLHTDRKTIYQDDSRKLLNAVSLEQLSHASGCTTPQSTPPLSPSLNDITSIVPPLTSNIQCSNWRYKNRLQNTTLKHRNKFQNDIKHKIKKICEELDLHTDEDQKVNKWHEEIKPRLKAAEQKIPFRILEYESRILQRLETSNRKLQFDDIIRQEPPCEVARYFSATLQLASTHNLNINTREDLEKSIELVLLD